MTVLDTCATTLTGFSDPAVHAQAPIGVFDSGVGGLSVAREILNHLPHEHMLYFADTAHVPYGNRSADEIRELTARGVAWLHGQGCKMAVIACNSASAFSLDGLRHHYGEAFPIVGLVPAVKPAVLHSRSKVIAVLATAATFRGQLIHEVIRHFAVPHGVTVMQIFAPELVPLIEQGQMDECASVLQRCLQPAVAAGADHLVLGCTHYPFLRPLMTRLYGEQFTILDSGHAVARQCGRILSNLHLSAEPTNQSGQMMLVFSGQDQAVRRPVIEQLMECRADWRFEGWHSPATSEQHRA